MRQEVISGIIRNGIKNLNEFGYANVTSINIFTDLLFSQFFKSMLEENKGKGADEEIDHLISRLNTQPD